MFEKQKKKIIFTAILTITTCFLSTASVDAYANNTDAEPTKYFETIQFQVLSTGDIHGQATAYNYETMQPDSNHGLSKIQTLITKTKNALPGDNSILVDAGDFLYDSTTNYFYDNQPDTTQPILQVMEAMKYDCITLGNHELDYPFEYLTEQLKASNLYDKTIVSNLTHIDSKENVFAPSMIITKEAVSSDGKVYPVRIGVVGATRQGLSTRRQYYGFLLGHDIYDSVLAEAKRMKANDEADLVIALVHGGIGVLSGSNTTTHPGGRLAKSQYIDGIVTSHTHELFPSKNNTYADSKYEKIVDEQKGLIYSTPVVGGGSDSIALGILDYTLGINKDGSYTILDSCSKVQTVTEKVSENKQVNNIYDKYMNTIFDSIDKTKYPIAKDQVYTNLDCFIQDNDLFQLYNNAKIQFGYDYVREHHPEYASLPVIACTSNIMDSTESDVIITEAFTEADISRIIAEHSVTRDSGYTHIFKITGYQLREWLEFNASIYADVEEATFENLIPSYYKKSPRVTPLLGDEYQDDHKKFYIFDGISYTIDLSKKPRYDSNGKMTFYTNKRITSLTYNGSKVKDDQEFLIVTDAFDIRYSFMPQDSQSIFTKNPWVTGKEIFINYVKELSKAGPINVKADNNWKIVAPEGYTFAVGMPYYTREYIEPKEWFVSYAVNNKELKNYPVYYRGNFEETAELTQGLNVILSVSKKSQTAYPVEIAVKITKSPSVKIAETKYLTGLVTDSSDKTWADATTVKSNKFSVKENGTYTVRIKDTVGNTAISFVTVNNINTEVLDAPICNTFTNRTDTLTGTTLPNAKVYAQLSSGTYYSTKANESGEFAITIPAQKAFDTVKIQAELRGLESEEIEVLVRRTGPDMPSVISDISAPTYIYSGFIDPYSTIYLRHGSTIYVNRGDEEIYKACDYANDTYKIVESDITYEKLGDITYFTADLPNRIAMDKTIYVYAIDKNGKSSKGLPLTIGTENNNSGISVDPSDNSADGEESLEADLSQDLEIELED